METPPNACNYSQYEFLKEDTHVQEIIVLFYHLHTAAHRIAADGRRDYCQHSKRIASLC
jgi:hypothetical protein